jgi:hypothetical protein
MLAGDRSPEFHTLIGRSDAQVRLFYTAMHIAADHGIIKYLHAQVSHRPSRNGIDTRSLPHLQHRGLQLQGSNGETQTPAPRVPR